MVYPFLFIHNMTAVGDSMVSSSLSSELSSISIDNDVNMKHALSLGYLRKEVEKAIIELGSETTQVGRFICTQFIMLMTNEENENEKNKK